MKTIGYLRVSTQDQSIDRQVDGLRDMCDELHIEYASAATMKRPVFDMIVQSLNPKDTLCVLDLDRAFRSTLDAIETADKLQKRGVGLRIVNLQLDSNTPAGRLVYVIMSACAEFERRLISQRTKEGMAAAKARGKSIGRPPKLSINDLQTAARQIEGGAKVRDAAEALGVASWSLRRALKRNGVLP
ncbi:recombinase family protein [Roseobacter sp. S98]|uniref:recombinase family protein n=1 Tax=Roseobacter algicola (ex Choi et al. 2025) (nom. illeg.) TaxID=3092138 RepID=UPI0035C6C1D5